MLAQMFFASFAIHADHAAYWIVKLTLYPIVVWWQFTNNIWCEWVAPYLFQAGGYATEYNWLFFQVVCLWLVSPLFIELYRRPIQWLIGDLDA